jgi:hypothetical protein
MVLSKYYNCTKFNPSKTEMKEHIQIQFIHRREHCVLVLERPVGECCIVNSRCLFCKSYGIHKYTVWSNYRDFNVQPGGTWTNNYYSSLRCCYGVLFHNVQKCEVGIFLTLPLACVPHFPVVYLIEFTCFFFICMISSPYHWPCKRHVYFQHDTRYWCVFRGCLRIHNREAPSTDVRLY